MKKLNENPIDQYFRETLESPDLKFNKQDWEGFKKMLPEKSKKKGLAWWYPASVAAAILLLFASLWLWDDRVKSTDQLSNVPGKQETPPFDESAVQGGNNQREERRDLNLPDNKTKNSGETGPAETIVGKNRVRNDSKSLLTGNAKFVSADAVQIVKADNKPQYNFLSTLPLKTLEILQVEKNPLFYKQPIAKINLPVEPAIKQTKTDVPSDLPSISRVSLALSLSPDINSINHFSKGSFGSSVGLGASYRLNSRLSVSSAIVYSKKVYSAEPYEYKAPWAYSAGKYAESIDADCRVLDIPLNLTYNFSKSAGRNLFASAGVSSYFMLKEKYTLNIPYNPAYPDSSNPAYSYRNRNKHLLSVINLSAGVEKSLNKQASLVIAPYTRLPLTGIGQGKVDLQSVGLNLQLNYRLKKKESRPISVNAAQ